MDFHLQGSPLLKIDKVFIIKIGLMEAGNYLFVVVLIVLVVGLILCPPLIVTILTILFIYSSVKNQKEEQRKNAELQRWRQERRINANLDAVNKKVAKKEKFKKNRL